MKIELESIGHVRIKEGEMFIEVDKKYRAGLIGLKEFSHVNGFWWFDGVDDKDTRSILSLKQPYKIGPPEVGVFASRHPERPNPIALSACEIKNIDIENGLIKVGFIDARDGSPVIDLKPYVPTLDYVTEHKVPDYFKRWPQTYEGSLKYNWPPEFNTPHVAVQKVDKNEEPEKELSHLSREELIERVKLLEAANIGTKCINDTIQHSCNNVERYVNFNISKATREMFGGIFTPKRKAQRKDLAYDIN